MPGYVVRIGSLFSGYGSCYSVSMPKGQYDRANSNWKPKKKREYPPEIIEKACSMYMSGMTIREIIDVFPKGFKVQQILELHLPERRTAAKRDQRGALNHMWKGEDAGYKALHLRVRSKRGKPGSCEACDSSTVRTEWANISGDYTDENDYLSLCLRCHRLLDAARRRYLGRRTSDGGDNNV